MKNYQAATTKTSPNYKKTSQKFPLKYFTDLDNGNPLQYSCLENPMDRRAWPTAYSPWGRKELDTTEAS